VNPASAEITKSKRFNIAQAVLLLALASSSRLLRRIAISVRLGEATVLGQSHLLLADGPHQMLGVLPARLPESFELIC
jgi:hypothetical protein